jgi:hypothetical protein
MDTELHDLLPALPMITRNSMYAKDMDAHNQLLVSMISRGMPAQRLTEVMLEVIIEAPHDLRHYWLEEDCECRYKP